MPILDRLRHHSHTLMVQSDSYRLKQKCKADLIPAVPHSQGFAPPVSRYTLTAERNEQEGQSLVV